MSEPIIREAKPGDEAAIHEAHMRSIREICIKDHGKDEIRGWGYRQLDDRWSEPISHGGIWVVEFYNRVNGVGFIRILNKNNETTAHLHALYLTPEVVGKGMALKLANLMLDMAKSKGAVKITLESSITAREFYKKLGFVDSEPMKKVDIGGYPVTCFPMILKI